MAVAAGLDRYARGRLVAKILRHHRGRTTQEGEWTCQHALIADRYQFRHSKAVRRCEDCHRIAACRTPQISVLFPRDLLAYAQAVVVTFVECARGGPNHLSLPGGYTGAHTIARLSLPPKHGKNIGDIDVMGSR